MLHGVKVLEYCRTVAGASCGRHLADLGAEVVKMEPPVAGDPSRRRGPFPGDIPDPEKSGLHLYVNRNKKGITLDPTTATGRELFLRLMKAVDVLVEETSPRDSASRRVDVEEVRGLNPRIVVTSITPFGQTGPYAACKAYPLTVYQAGGIGHNTPEGYQNIDRPPLKQGWHVSEYHGGVGAAIATLGALVQARARDEGCHIDFSLQEWEMSLLKAKWEMFSFQGVRLGRNTVSRQGNSMTRCKDGYVIIILYEEHQWLRFIEVAGKEAWLLDERFADPYARAEHGEALARLIAEWAKDYTMAEIYHMCQARGVPVGMVNRAEDLYGSPQLENRGFFVEIEHPVAGKLRYPGIPFAAPGTRRVHTPAPTLGQHNEEIYCRRLGLTREDLLALYRASVI